MPAANDAPPYYYIALIDEAGDPGLRRVRPIDEPGASEWLVFGCVLIQATRERQAVDWVRSTLEHIGLAKEQELHFRELADWRKPLVCQRLATFPLRTFALLSNKKNMRGHTNPRAAARSPAVSANQYFYNYCVRLLLERVTDYVYRHSMALHGQPRCVKIVFSKRDGHAHGHTIAYHEVLRQQSRSNTTFLNKRTIRWQVLDRRLMGVEPPNLNAGLQLADVVASSFYQAVDVLPPTIWNPDNAKLLLPRVAREGGLYRDYGVALQPTPPRKAKLVSKQKQIFEFYGYEGRDF